MSPEVPANPVVPLEPHRQVKPLHSCGPRSAWESSWLRLGCPWEFELFLGARGLVPTGGVACGSKGTTGFRGTSGDTGCV